MKDALVNVVVFFVSCASILLIVLFYKPEIKKIDFIDYKIKQEKELEQSVWVKFRR